MISLRQSLFYVLATAVLIAFAAGCADLDVENPNAPDRDRAIAEDSDLVEVLSGAYVSWWDGTYENLPSYSPEMHLDGWGDAMATTNAFSGFWNIGTDEPRNRINNTLANDELFVWGDTWEGTSAAISSANDVIREIEEEGRDIVVGGQDRTDELLASAYFIRALSYGVQANFFDQAYIITADIPEEELADPTSFLADYDEVLEQAKDDFEATRDVAEASSFTVGGFFPWGIQPDDQRLIELANSFEARYTISNPRTSQENEAIDWNEILQLTQNGIQEDVIFQLDGSTWQNFYHQLSGVYWYWRVDNRIINRMDDEYPIKYPEDEAGTAIAPAQSDDARLCPTEGEEEVFDRVFSGADNEITFFGGDARPIAEELDCYFVYDRDQSFFTLPRGPKLQSNYWYARDFVIEQWFETSGSGDGPVMFEEENRLMQAEAEIRANGDAGAAANLVNQGSRTEVGELPPVNGSEEEVLEAIYYERDIELYRTGFGLPYYDLRRKGELQEGTPLHFPLPADELQTLELDLYSFGGAGEPEFEQRLGEEIIGTATGDNAWCDQGELSCDGPHEPRPGEVPGASLELDKQDVQDQEIPATDHPIE